MMQRSEDTFLKAAIEQRQQMLQVYAGLEVRCKQFHTFIETFYNDYKTNHVTSIS